MEVCAYTSKSAFQLPPEIKKVGLDELFSTADIVSLNCPLTPDTQGLVNAARLATMKSTAILINTGRGPLVVEQGPGRRAQTPEPCLPLGWTCSPTSRPGRQSPADGPQLLHHPAHSLGKHRPRANVLCKSRWTTYAPSRPEKPVNNVAR